MVRAVRDPFSTSQFPLKKPPFFIFAFHRQVIELGPATSLTIHKKYTWCIFGAWFKLVVVVQF